MSAASPAPPINVTADQVREMFQKVNSKICDDQAAIQQSHDSLRARYLKDSNDSDPLVRLKAKQWFKDTEALLNRRAGLLEVAYQKFYRFAEVTLKAVLNTGGRELTPELVEQVRELSLNECGVEEALADHWIQRYLKERHLTVGKQMVTVDPVRDFTAASGLGQIELSWTPPNSNYELVEITRVDAEASTTKESLVYQGPDRNHVDRGVMVGHRYLYQARAVVRDNRSSVAEAQAYCLGEVAHAAAEVRDGRVKLSWQLPNAGTAVRIFRRVGSPPALQRNGTHVACVAPTEQFLPGVCSKWEDAAGEEGETIHYLIVADFGGDQLTRGVPVEVTIQKAPPAVPSVTAQFKRGGAKDTVIVEWPPVAGTGIQYCVVRQEGSVPAARPDDGVVIHSGAQPRCNDTQLESGRRYTYTVFTQSGALASRTGTAAEPVDILPDVAGLNATTGNGVVELAWKSPPNVADVIVRRSLSPPSTINDGTEVKLTGSGHAKDQGLRNDKLYHYLVVCVFRPDGVNELYSAGARIDAAPERLPEPVAAFHAVADGRAVHCSWQSPEHGDVVVRRSATAPPWREQERMAADVVLAFGEAVTAEHENKALDGAPDPNQPYYAVFTVAGSHAVLGVVQSCVVCPDVTNLSLSIIPEGIALKWDWPEGITAVKMMRGVDVQPEAATDRKALGKTIPKGQFERDGERWVDHIDLPEQIRRGAKWLHYAIFAQAPNAPSLFYSPGTGTGCRIMLELVLDDGRGTDVEDAMWTQIQYRLTTPEKADLGKSFNLHWALMETSPRFAGFSLVASHLRVPQDADEGIELYRWVPAGAARPAQLSVKVSLKPVLQRGWEYFFCKLFPVRRDQAERTLIIHPNTARPIYSNGYVEWRGLDQSVRKYQAGVPKTIVCPNCFAEFPVEQMLFTDSGDGSGKRLPGEWSLIDKAKGLPPRPPMGDKGKKLVFKVCPKCDKSLPFSAGDQVSLMVGLIGAKSSGKSHYIASLVHRLEGEVGREFSASLIPSSDDTTNRYKHEFYDPLFKNRIKIPPTVGTPPPLIYDFSLDERIWNPQQKAPGRRGITLALFDTAGENLDRAENARKTVTYLQASSGIIFLIDPLQISELREQLPQGIPVPDQDTTADPQIVIGNVVNLLRQYEAENARATTASDRLATPVAVVLTKCDVLRDLGTLEANRAWHRERTPARYYDSDLHEDTSGMIEEWVQVWSPATYNIVRDQFSHHAFFGVSATGASLIGAQYPRVAPWRVEDPLLWLLAELGVIPQR